MAATEPADSHQPQVQNMYGWFFATRHFKDLTFCKLTFCKPDVSGVLKPNGLKPDVLKPDVLWVYLFYSVGSVDISVFRGLVSYPSLSV
jgi:hypothetical protein